MGKNLDSIPEGAFMETPCLRRVRFPYKLISIGDYAFKNSGLNRIELPKTLTIIGRGAFENLGNGAYAESDNYLDIDLPPSLAILGDRAFIHIGNLRVHVNGIFDTSGHAFSYNQDLTVIDEIDNDEFIRKLFEE